MVSVEVCRLVKQAREQAAVLDGSSDPRLFEELKSDISAMVEAVDNDEFEKPDWYTHLKEMQYTTEKLQGYTCPLYITLGSIVNKMNRWRVE